MGAAFFAGAASLAGASVAAILALSSAPYSASNFFTAGNSILDDAVLANSPMALNFSSASLLVMP